MSTKITIDNSSGSFIIDGSSTSAPVPSEAGATLISNSSNQWVSQAVPTSWRNRLINGDMAISQRNGDAFVTPTSSGVYVVDRWRGSNNIINGYSAYFDGSGDYLTTPANNTALQFGTSAYTVECWVYATARNANGSYIIGGTGTIFQAAILNDGAVAVSLAGVTTLAMTSTTVPLNQWTHIAIVRSSTAANGLSIYINGILGTTARDIRNHSSTTSTVEIARTNASDLYNYAGYISNLRVVIGTAVYTSAFTPSTVPLAAIAGTSYLACAGPLISTDKSSNNFTVTAVGNAQLTQASPFPTANLTATVGRETGYSAYFDGSGDYAYVNGHASLHLSADFTIECWVYYNNNTQGILIAQYGGVTNLAYNSWNLGVGSDNSLYFYVRPSNAATPIAVSLFSNADSVSINQWFHVAITRSGNTYRMFINGILSQTGTSASSPYNPGTSRGLAIAASPIDTWGSSTSTYNFSGYISNLRIVKGTALYTANFTPSTMPLVPATGTSLLACASSTFADKSSNNFTVTAVGNAAVSAINPFAQAGFGKSLRWAVSTPASPDSTNQALIQQRVEGSNIYDFSWGTAGARAATLSFWVNSPVVGTYCVAVQNPSLDRSYVAEYTVSAANTWERKTVNVPGPTSGFWPTNNSEGLRVSFDMGSGTNYNTTAGAWQTGNFTRTAGALSFSAQALVASSLTNNFYVVGTQLELGSVATPFEVIPYAKQIESCQRYYARMGSLSGNYVGFGAGCTFQGGTSVGIGFVYVKYPQRMRAAPTINQSGTAVFNTTVRAVTSLAAPYVGTDSLSVSPFTAANTQTVGQGVVWTGNNNASAYIDLDAEL